MAENMRLFFWDALTGRYKIIQIYVYLGQGVRLIIGDGKCYLIERMI